MNAGKLVSKVILREHDLSDLCEIVGLVLFNPKDLGSGESGECDVSGELGELSLADLVVEIIGLSSGTSVVPKDCGTNDVVIFIKYYKTVHLSAKRDTGNL